MKFVATTSPGLEGVLKNELSHLRFEGILAHDKMVEFTGDETALVEANLWLRTAQRVYISVAE